MQRALLVIYSLLALYADAAAQTLTLPNDKSTASIIKIDHPLPPTGTTTAEPQKSTDKTLIPHIALLLPINSTMFGASAQAVYQGFMAAAGFENSAFPIRIYSNFDEDNSVLSVYKQAIANGAIAVVGPLSRNGVVTLTKLHEFPVPTLTLNIVDNILDRNLYFWGLAIEAEARQTAQIIAPKNFDKIIIVRTNSGLSKRLQVAFDDEWHRLSSTPIETLEFAEDPLLLNGITDLNNTAIFLAMDADKAHLLKPYLPNKVPVYATSRVFNGNSDTLTNFDLDGIHFVDMPWLLQADHPAVMTYPHSSPPLSADSERLYALGIDAFRIAQLLIKGNVTNALPLDGVSGQIQLRGHSFQRTSIPAVFDQGSATLNDIPITRHTDFPEPTVKNLN